MFDPYIRSILDYPEAYLPDLILLLTLVSGLVSIVYLDQPMRFLLLVVFSIVCVEMMMVYNATHTQSNHYVININSFVETIGLAVVYFIEMKNKRNRIIIALTSVIYLVVFVNTLSQQTISDGLLSTQRIIMISYVFLHFQYILSSVQVPNLLKYKMFWVSSGVIIYALGTLLIFLFGKYTLANPKPNSDFRFFIYSAQYFSIIFYLGIAAGFWLSRREGRFDKRLIS